MVRAPRTTRLGLGLTLVCCSVAGLPGTSSAASWVAARLVPNAGFEEGGAFQGQHSCSSDDVSAGLCTTPFGNSRVGLVTWPKDRFASFHAGTGGGSVTTRTLSPSGSTLSVNVAPGSGSLSVEVLDAAGDPVPGYAAADATPITADTLGAAVRWGTRTTLPAGPLRLRFDLTAGDLYSYTIG
ncbi:MAG: hypothetical protein ACRDP6_22630 [Actinoallomurus sp.]